MPARILILTTTGSWGGTENQVFHQARHLSERRFPLTVGTLEDGDGSLLQELAAYPQISTFSLHATKRTPWRVMDLAIRLGEERPDLIIAYLFHSYLTARILGRLFRRIPLISNFRSGEQGKWRCFLDRLTMQLTEFFVVPSEDSARFALEELGVIEKKLRVIPVGVDVAWLRSPKLTREEARANLGLRDEDFAVGCVARFHPVKDHETLLRAFRELKGKSEGQRAKLLLVGKGKDDLRVRALAERLDLLGDVIFAGFRRNLPEIYAAMDAFCLTSRHEGMPNAVLEAMATAKPIIATKAPGTSAILSHRHNALLVPVGNPTAVAEALAEIFNDPEMAAGLVRQATVDVSEKFSIEASNSAYDALINELLNSRGD